MSEFADVTAAVLAQVTRVVKALSDEDMKHIASGETRIALLPRGYKIIEQSPALDQAVKVVSHLTETELHQIEAREARLVLLRKGEKVIAPFDAVELAAQIAKLTSEAEVVRFLDADPRLGAPNLKKVASELNIAIPPNVRTKPAMQLHIAQAVIRDRGHWNWR